MNYLPRSAAHHSSHPELTINAFTANAAREIGSFGLPVLENPASGAIFISVTRDKWTKASRSEGRLVYTLRLSLLKIAPMLMLVLKSVKVSVQPLGPPAVSLDS